MAFLGGEEEGIFVKSMISGNRGIIVASQFVCSMVSLWFVVISENVTRLT